GKAQSGWGFEQCLLKNTRVLAQRLRSIWHRQLISQLQACTLPFAQRPDVFVTANFGSLARLAGPHVSGPDCRAKLLLSRLRFPRLSLHQPPSRELLARRNSILESVCQLRGAFSCAVEYWRFISGIINQRAAAAPLVARSLLSRARLFGRHWHVPLGAPLD